MERNRPTEYPIWDIAKLVFAFFVVGIHTRAHTGNPDMDFFLQEWLGRIAVPMFFCLAGYHLFCKNPDGKALRRYAVRILGMYLIWTVFYLIVKIVSKIDCPTSGREWFVYLEYVVIRGDSYTHLWYLSSLCMAVFLLWLFTRFCSLRVTFVISLALYFFGLIWLPHFYLVKGVVEQSSLLTAGYTTLNRFLGWPRNGTFFGFVFVTMGALFSRENQRRLSPNADWILAFLSIGLSFLEVWWIRGKSGAGNDTYCALQLSLLPTVYFLFHALKAVDIPTKPVYKKLRICSTYIYLLHPFVLLLLELLIPIKPVRSVLRLPLAFWCITYVLSFGLSYLLVLFEGTQKGKFLKRLH